MTSQKVTPCEFDEGHCIHCGDSGKGECEGWVEPEFLAAVRILKDEIEALTKERDFLVMAYTADQMQAYGQACRAQALEEAAEYLDSRRYFGLAEKVKEMK